jgi:hypothetical protein
LGQLNGRQWGLVAIVAGSPLLCAFLLGGLHPLLLQPVLGTTLGGLSWVLAALLGLVGGLLFARRLARLQQSPGLMASPVRRSLGLILAALPPIGLCVAPAVLLLLAGPAYATSLSYEEGLGQQAATTLHSTVSNLADQVRRGLPRQLPLAPEPSPRW